MLAENEEDDDNDDNELYLSFCSSRICIIANVASITSCNSSCRN